MKPNPRTNPITGATTMKIRVLVQPLAIITPGALRHPCRMLARAKAAPAYPPINACEDDVGNPSSHVSTSHTIAPSKPAKTTYWVTISSSIIPLPIVLATAVPSRNAARKLKAAAHTTASRGDKHASGNHSRNAVGRVMEAIQKIEYAAR